MKKIFIASILTLMTSHLLACAANTISYYPLTSGSLGTDSCGTNNLTVNGSMSYSGAGCASETSASGIYTDSNYFSAGSGGLNAAFSSQSAYTIEFYVYLVSGANFPVAFSWQDGGNNFIQLNPGGPLRFVAGATLDGTFNIQNGVCYGVAVTVSGSTRKVYMNNTLLNTDASGHATGTVTGVDIGRYIASTSFAVNGYINDVRISNIARTSFPTNDPATTPTNTPTQTQTFTVSPTQTQTFTATPTSTMTANTQPSDFAPGPIGLSAMSNLLALPNQKSWTQAIGMSSYDVTGANVDYNNWAYTYLSGSVGVGVVADLVGPGCLYRLWGTATNPATYFRYTVYVDGVPTVVSGTTLADGTTWATMFSGSFGPFVSPLTVSYAASSGGNSIYLPIPFQKSLKILDYQSPAGSYDYYNLEAHMYGAGTYVTPWTGAEDSSAVRAIWNSIPNDPKNDAGELTASATVNMVAGSTQTIFNQAGPAQIVGLKINVPSYNTTKLNNLYIQIYWDGNNTPSVNAPLAFFFNAGGLYSITVTPQQLMAGIDNSGNLYNYLPMPYLSRAKINLVNNGGADINGITCTVNYASHPGTFAGVGYLCSQYGSVYVDSNTPVVNLLTANGFGSYIGSIMSLNTVIYFEEGDEAIYVDGSNTPIIHGTGTEDYNNAGWGWQYGAFSLPLYGASYVNPAPSGAPATVNFTRFLLSDQVPYQSNIQVNIQHGTTCAAGVPVTYTSLAWYYNQPTPLITQSDVLDLSSSASKAAHNYVTTGAPVNQGGSYLEDVSSTCASTFQYTTGVAYTSNGTCDFDLSIPTSNNGMILRGMLDQTNPKRAVEVTANGQDVGMWYLPGSNSSYPWLDSDFMIPPQYTAGDSSVHIQLKNVSGTAWAEYKYTALPLNTLPVPGTSGGIGGLLLDPWLRDSNYPPLRRLK